MTVLDWLQIPVWLFLGITLWNLIWLKWHKTPFKKGTFVVIIPARNEELKIGKLLESIIQQNLKPQKVIVASDHSTDQTNNIVLSFAQKYSWIELLEVSTLPKGWKGKQWACYQGYQKIIRQKVTFEKIVFLDADVWLRQEALEKITQNISDFYTYYPSQKYVSTDILLTPLVNWIVLTFLPLQLAHQNSNPLLSAANGQCLVFSKNCYEVSGTHEAVKDSLLEDVEFARLVKKLGYKIEISFGDFISCQMYQNFVEAVNGFSKNIIPKGLFDAIVFVVGIFLICLLFLNPTIWWLIFIQRCLVTYISKQSFREVWLHTFQMLCLLGLSFFAFLKHRQGQIEWKGRKYPVKI